MKALLAGLCFVTGCGGGGSPASTTSSQPVVVTVAPAAATLQPGSSERFAATVNGVISSGVVWAVSLADDSGVASNAGAGTISASGVYVAPINISATTTVAVTATSVSDPTAAASAMVTVNCPTVIVKPASATVPAGSQKAFTVSAQDTSSTTFQWLVNGVAGGNPIWGTISAAGMYTAPAIDPGKPVTVSAASVVDISLAGHAIVQVVNPPIPTLEGATYDDEIASWEAVILPAVEQVGLVWDGNARVWNPAPGWAPPAAGITQQVYYLEQFLRPLTRMAIAKQDIPLMQELAAFHLALLQYRTSTIADIRANAPGGAWIWLDGQPTDRTFPWYEPDGNIIRIRDDQQANAQYLSIAAQLLRAIAELPAASRTKPLLEFVHGYSGFLASEQLLRLFYGTTPWAFGLDSNIPEPLVAGWAFLAQTGYRTPSPYKYVSAMTDTQLWLVADAAEVLGAQRAAPELDILDDYTRAKLGQAVVAGVSLMRARCRHTVASDGADVLSVFAGDNDDYPGNDYAGDTGGPQLPTIPNPKAGLEWDISHSYRFPIVFRCLYETRQATGTDFPTLTDLVALANSYVHQAFTGNWNLPIFNNYFDGWNGWANVDLSTPFAYPPYQYCNSRQSPPDCLTPGAAQGWGQLAFANPELARLIQSLVDLAYDDSADAIAFKDQYYYDSTGPYSVTPASYPWLMILLVGDSADRLP